MTLKYESEILFDLMKRDGDDTPSDVLPYESELKEKYLEQVEGAYPKLMDYHPEWLNYNLVAHLPADFPVETLSNVTSATIDNVVPYAYGCAILKGQTLVNLANVPKSSTLISNANLKLNPTYIKPSTTYTIFINMKTLNTSKTLQIGSLNESMVNAPLGNFTLSLGVNKIKITTRDNTVNLRIVNADSFGGETVELSDVMIIEGDYTIVDIPYFEGMQSVKMPVLTTSNEDGTKTNILTVNEDVTLRSNGDICDELNLLTGQLTQRIGEDGVVLSQEVVKTFDLTVTDQDGNTESIIRPIEGTMYLMTEGIPLKPLFSGEIPVEAITQNLASFIKE